MEKWWRPIGLIVVGLIVLALDWFNVTTLVLRGTDLNYGYIAIALGVVVGIITAFQKDKSEKAETPADSE